MPRSRFALFDVSGEAARDLEEALLERLTLVHDLDHADPSVHERLGDRDGAFVVDAIEREVEAATGAVLDTVHEPEAAKRLLGPRRVVHPQAHRLPAACDELLDGPVQDELPRL